MENTATKQEAQAPKADGNADSMAAVAQFQERLARGLVDSSHNFRKDAGQPLDLCTPCHTPHIAAGRAPLLDKRPQSLATLRPYQALGIKLHASSLLCLSCHDGVFARDVFSFAHATRSPVPLGTSWVGTGSVSSHPVGVKFPVAKETFHAVAAVTADGRIKLPDGRVQCISCHDPHNSHRIPGMLVRANDGSRLCLTCHHL